MKLVTRDVEAQLRRVPFHSLEGVENPAIVIKFFTPDAQWSWFVLEAEKQPDGDWHFFGMVHGLEREMGYFSLSELQAVRGGLGLPVERDLYFIGHLNDVR